MDQNIKEPQTQTEEKQYTQKQVDNIADSVRNTEQKKYSDLETRFNDLQAQNTKLNQLYDDLLKTQDKLVYDAHKSTFISNGGNPNCFDDFNTLHGKEFDTIKWDELAKNKPHFFTNTSNEVTPEFFDKSNFMNVDDISKGFADNRASFEEEFLKQIYKK